MSASKFLRGQTDFFVGRRGRVERYLVCSLQGYFPVLARTGAETLAVIFRTGGTHIGACGTLAVAGSSDGGRSWSDPVEITSRWEDSRNPAFGVNGGGELIAAYWKACMDHYADSDGGPQWSATPGDFAKASTFVRTSADGGKKWSAETPYRSSLLTLASPYGRIVAGPRGGLLMAVYGSPRRPVEGVHDISTVARSVDGGKTWGDETLLAVKHNETALAFLPDGRLMAAARSESGRVATLFSDDGGRSWSQPSQVTRDGEHPADLTVLSGGKVLMTFGRRICPMGCGALLSADGGKTWNAGGEVLLSADSISNGDLGYPSTVQLADGKIVTAYYTAGGSAMSAGYGGWGDVTCQAIHYRLEDIG